MSSAWEKIEQLCRIFRDNRTKRRWAISLFVYRWSLRNQKMWTFCDSLFLNSKQLTTENMKIKQLRNSHFYTIDNCFKKVIYLTTLWLWCMRDRVRIIFMLIWKFHLKKNAKRILFSLINAMSDMNHRRHTFLSSHTATSKKKRA